MMRVCRSHTLLAFLLSFTTSFLCKQGLAQRAGCDGGYAALSGKSGGPISAYILSAQKGITGYQQVNKRTEHIVVDSFHVTITRNDVTVLKMKSESCYFTEQLKTFFSTLVQGDKIVFDAIFARMNCPGPTSRWIQPMEFIIQ